MKTPWYEIDRFLIGEAWAGSQIGSHLTQLCDQIGPRWASSEQGHQTIRYIREQFSLCDLDKVDVENYEMDTWSWSTAEATLDSGHELDVLPLIWCPSFELTARVVDIGFGTPREITAASNLRGTIAIVDMAHEPFTSPIPIAYRLSHLAQSGAAAAIIVDVKLGGRKEYHSAHDLKDPDFPDPPLPAVTVSREDGRWLQRHAGRHLHLTVKTKLYRAPSANVVAELNGVEWPDEHLVIGAHHDTVYDTAGGNDNSSGVIALLETARVLAELRRATGQHPGRNIRFVTYSAEEQRFQGSFFFVNSHYGPEIPPRLALNLDELSTGHFKGIVLGFPHLQPLVQGQLDDMGDGHQCHVMAQIDATSDHFPFLAAGLDAAHLWRWRFHGRHSDSDFHHEPGDSADKVNVRELKEYVAHLSRLLLRLSRVAPPAWPVNPMTKQGVSARLRKDRGTVVRVY